MAPMFIPGVSAPTAIPSPVWSGFDIPLPWGTLRIHAYALCILAGIVVALWLTARRWKARGGNADAIWDIAIWAIPAGIIGGRLYHVFTSPDRYFGPGYNGTGDLSAIPRIWEGGLGIWGAVVLGAVGAWIGCRRSGARLTAFMDAGAPGLLLAQAIGRWGNYFNQELFGGPTTLPWGLEVDPGSPNFPAGYAPGTLFHPTFLYEMVWNVVGVILLLLLDRRFRFRGGRLFWLYAVYYTVGRVWIEALRIDDAQMITIAGVTARLNVWTSILVFVGALIVLSALTLRRSRESESVWLAGRSPAVKDDVGAAGSSADGTDPDHGIGADQRLEADAAETPVDTPATSTNTARSSNTPRSNTPRSSTDAPKPSADAPDHGRAG